MQPAAFKILFDGRSAKQADLDRVENITVHQVMDQLWEASIALEICASENGTWNDDDSFARPFHRIRIEVQVGSGSFVPLIDGPVVGTDPQLQAQPGGSTRILRVYDDGISLARKDNLDKLTGNDDAALAKKIFQQVTEIQKTQIDPTAPGPSDRPTGILPRGTLLEALQFLARRHPKMHAWVKPGPRAGESIGMFKTEDERTSGLPALVLLGADRNMDSFTISENVQRPAHVVGAQLNTKDLTVSKSKALYGDALDGGEPAVDADKVGEVSAPPGYGVGVDLEDALKAKAAGHALAYEAEGTLRGYCYDGVLEPYRRITVKGVGAGLSGDWLIRSVTHTITRSEYSQAFGLQRRDRSSGASATTPGETVA